MIVKWILKCSAGRWHLDNTQAVRLGAGGAQQVKAARFKRRTFRMGFRPVFRWDKALDLAASMDDEELVRKLQTRK